MLFRQQIQTQPNRPHQRAHQQPQTHNQNTIPNNNKPHHRHHAIRTPNTRSNNPHALTKHHRTSYKSHNKRLQHQRTFFLFYTSFQRRYLVRKATSKQKVNQDVTSSINTGKLRPMTRAPDTGRYATSDCYQPPDHKWSTTPIAMRDHCTPPRSVFDCATLCSIPYFKTPGTPSTFSGIFV